MRDELPVKPNTPHGRMTAAVRDGEAGDHSKRNVISGQSTYTNTSLFFSDRQTPQPDTLKIVQMTFRKSFCTLHGFRSF